LAIQDKIRLLLYNYAHLFITGYCIRKAYILFGSIVKCNYILEIVKMAKKDFKNDGEIATVENVEPVMVTKKPSRKESGEQRSKIDTVEGIDGTFTKCQRSNATGDIALNFELDGHLIRCTVNPITEKVRGRVIHITPNTF